MQRSAVLSSDFGVMVLVGATAWIAFGLSWAPTAVFVVGTCTLLAILPIALIAPARWSDEISQAQYMREACWLAATAVVSAMAAGVDPPHAPRMVLGAAAGFLLLAGRLPWRRGLVNRPLLLATASNCAIAGVLLDLPGTVGWNSLAFGAFGAAAFMSLGAARHPGLEPTGGTGRAPQS